VCLICGHVGCGGRRGGDAVGPAADGHAAMHYEVIFYRYYA